MQQQTLSIQSEKQEICAVYGCVNESKKVIESSYLHNKTQLAMFETKTAVCEIHADIISETEATNNKVKPLSKSFSKQG